ncbi:MAG: ribose-5-phosphate isomerase RpiA [Planctomycetota bacterium]|nr:ribose-5-phosphate isomerase RpiA [Planctomycetota bacterium]
MAENGRTGNVDDPAVRAAVHSAVEMVRNGDKVGIGSGRASTAFINALGQLVQQGLAAQCVAASEGSDNLARSLGIPLIELGEDVELDIIVDGADEVAPNLDLIKGWGGALVRERIVASVAKRRVVMVSPEKLVKTLGERGRIPVEIIPLARGCVSRQLKRLSLVPTLRLNKDGTPFVSDNHNLTLDCALTAPLRDPAAARELEARLLKIPGVVETGLFLDWVDTVLVGRPDGTVDVLERRQRGNA